MEEKRTIRFLEDREVRDHEDRVVAAFKRGKSYPLEPTSAERWVKRGAAEYTEADLRARRPKALTKAEEAAAAAGGATEPGPAQADAQPDTQAADGGPPSADAA